MFCSNFFRLFSLYFSVFEASTYLQAQRFFPQPIKGILYFCYSFFFFFWARAFLFIFRISICLLTLPAYSCMLSTFYIRAPSVWMVVVLLIDSQWDNSNISALCGSGSDAWSSSSNCVFCLLVYLASFLLKVKFGTLYFKNCYKWAFGLPR